MSTITMKTLLTIVCALALSAVYASSSDLDTIRVPKDIPLDMLANIWEETSTETVIIDVSTSQGKTMSYTATDLMVYRDSAMWSDSIGVVKMSMDDIVSIMIPTNEKIGWGAGMGIGMVSGVLIGGLIGSATAPQETGYNFVMSDQAASEMSGGFIGFIAGGLLGAVFGASRDGTIWVFQH